MELLAEKWHTRALNVDGELSGEREQALDRTTTIFTALGEAWFEHEEWNSSTKWFEKALANHDQVHGTSHPKRSTILLPLGLSHWQMGRRNQATDYLKQALKVEENSRQQANIWTHLGDIFLEQREAPDALNAFEQALDLVDEEEKGIVGELLTRMGDVHVEENRLDDALTFYERAFSLFEAKSENSVKAKNRMGRVMMKQGDFESARECFESSLEIFPNMTEALSNMGELYHLLGSPTKAEEYFWKSQQRQSGLFDTQTKDTIQRRALEALSKTEHSDLPEPIIDIFVASLQSSREWADNNPQYVRLGNLNDHLDVVRKLLASTAPAITLQKSMQDEYDFFLRHDSTKGSLAPWLAKQCRMRNVKLDEVPGQSDVACPHVRPDIQAQLQYAEQELHAVQRKLHLNGGKPTSGVHNRVGELFVLINSILDQVWSHLHQSLPDTVKNDMMYFPTSESKRALEKSLRRCRWLSPTPDEYDDAVKSLLGIKTLQNTHMWKLAQNIGIGKSKNRTYIKGIESRFSSEMLLCLYKRNQSPDPLKHIASIIFTEDVGGLSKEKLQELWITGSWDDIQPHVNQQLPLIQEIKDTSSLNSFRQEFGMKVNQMIQEVRSKMQSRKYLDTHFPDTWKLLLDEMPFAYFDSGQMENSWRDQLSAVNNDGKHLRLIPQTVEREEIGRASLIKEQKIEYHIDYLEPLPQLYSWSLYPILQRWGGVTNGAELTRLSRAIRWFLLAKRPSDEQMSWDPYFIREDGRIPYYKPTTFCTNLVEQGTDALRTQLEDDLIKNNNGQPDDPFFIPIDSGALQSIEQFLCTRSQRQQNAVPVLEMKPDFTFYAFPLLERALVQVAKFAKVSGKEANHSPHLMSSNTPVSITSTDQDGDLYRATLCQASHSLQQGHEDQACQAWQEGVQEASSEHLQALMRHKALKLTRDWRTSCTIRSELISFYRRHEMPGISNDLLHYYSDTDEMQVTSLTTLDVDLQAQWERAKSQCIKLRWMAIELVSTEEEKKRQQIVIRGTILEAQIAIKLRHLLDQAIFRWCRQCIGVPNNTFVPQFNFPRTPRELREDKQLYPGLGHDKQLSDFPLVENTLERLVKEEWLLDLMNYSNQAKHKGLELPFSAPTCGDLGYFGRCVALGRGDCSHPPTLLMLEQAVQEVYNVLELISVVSERGSPSSSQDQHGVRITDLSIISAETHIQHPFPTGSN